LPPVPTAIEAADIALMGDDLTIVAYAINLGKLTKKISRQNIVFSLLILCVMISAARLGVLSVASAIFFHETFGTARRREWPSRFEKPA